MSDIDDGTVLADVVWSGKDWVAVSLDEQVFPSGDGIRWHIVAVPWPAKPYVPESDYEVANRFRLAAGNNTVIAVANGLTLVRDCNSPSPRRGNRRTP